MSEHSPSSPSSPAELSSADSSGWSNEWSSLENYEDPRLEGPPVAIGYDPSRVVAMSQNEIDSIGDDLFAQDDSEQSRAWLSEALLEKGFSEKDLESGVAAVEVDGELVAVVIKPNDFGTRLINVEFTPIEESAQEALGEQAEVFNKLVDRLKEDLANTGLELSLKGSSTIRQEMQREVSDVIGIVKKLSNSLMEGQPASDEALAQFSDRMNILRIAINNDAETVMADARRAEGLSSDVEDASSSAQKSLDDEAPEREEFYNLTSKLTELSEDLRSSTLRNVNASEEVATNLGHLLNTVEELRYSRYGHETFGRMLYEYAARLEEGAQDSGLSRRQIEDNFRQIKQLLG